MLFHVKQVTSAQPPCKILQIQLEPLA